MLNAAVAVMTSELPPWDAPAIIVEKRNVSCLSCSHDNAGAARDARSADTVL